MSFWDNILTTARTKLGPYQSPGSQFSKSESPVLQAPLTSKGLQKVKQINVEETANPSLAKQGFWASVLTPPSQERFQQELAQKGTTLGKLGVVAGTAASLIPGTPELKGAGAGLKAGEELLHTVIGKINIIKGAESTAAKSGFGLAKITGDHPEVLPYLKDALSNAKIVEKLPQRTILESTGENPMRIIIDHQLGKEPKTFLNNAYFLDKNVPQGRIGLPTQGSSNLRSANELLRQSNNIQNLSKSQVTKTGESIIPVLAKEAIPVSSKIPENLSPGIIQKLSQKGSSYFKDISTINNSQGISKGIINTNNLKISNEGKNLINNAVEAVKPYIDKSVGKTLSNQEAINIANQSSKIFSKAVDRNSTLQWEAGLLNLRRKIAQSADTGTVDKNFINDLLALKSRGADIGRRLQSFAIEASGQAVTPKQAILDSVLKVNQNVDEILAAAKGVDFNDYNQASDFYRQFISPKSTEILDLVRYNSMLSSPNTHLVNIFSNLVNTTIVAPIEKTLIGTVDFLGSKIGGYAQTRLPSEGATYLKGYLNNIGEASQRFSDVLKGKKAFTNLDIQNIPIATKGFKGGVAKALSYPSRLLEASDQFFTALAQVGETAALSSRVKAGIPVKNINLQAQTDAAYRLFRQDLFDPNQGKVLDMVDRVTQMVSIARNSPNQIVSTIAKFTVPFLKTPMNILKQGIEYSPAGFSTIIGAKDKLAQAVKASVGSAVFSGAAIMLTSGRITGAEPLSSKEKADFRASGKQPYAVKIGNKWVSYQKLPPGISFPLAMVSILNDLEKNKTIDQDTSDLVLTGIAKYGQFLSDQSYAKSIGDLLSAVKGGENSISQLISNYPRQIIPFSALGGWITRLVDTTQRKVDSKASFIEKQMQTLMLNIPGLSQKVPARLDNQGNPIKNTNTTLNAFSPVKITSNNAKLEEFLNNQALFNKAVKEQRAMEDKIKSEVKPIYDQAMKLKAEGKTDEAMALINDLTDEQYDAYKSLRSADKTRQTKEGESGLFPIVQQVQQLKLAGKITEAQAIVDGLSDDEYRYYQLAKKKLGYN